MGDWSEEFERAQEVSEMEEWLDEDFDEEKAPQNLPKADAYSLLAEVRAMADRGLCLCQMLEKRDKCEIFLTGASQRLVIKEFRELYKKVSEHFS
jgi:hypothetical protein